MIYKSSVDTCTIDNNSEKIYSRSAGCHSTLWKDYSNVVFVVTGVFHSIVAFFPFFSLFNYSAVCHCIRIGITVL